MKQHFKILLLVLFPCLVNAQQNVDSLKKVLAKTTIDSTRYNVCGDIYNYYEETNRDSALYYSEQRLLLARKHNKKLAEAYSLDNKGYQLIGLGQYASALECLFQAFKIVEDPSKGKEKTWPLFSRSFTGNNRLLMLAFTHHMFAILMWQTQNSEQEIFHFKEARIISEKIGHTIRQMMADMNLGRDYLVIGKLDSALIYEKEAEQLAFQSGFKKYLGQVYTLMGGIYYRKGEKMKAKQDYYLAVEVSKEQKNLTSLSFCYFNLAKFYLAENEKDSALNYAIKNLRIFQSLGSITGTEVNLGTIYENIYLSYKLKNQVDSAYKYQGLALDAIDSLSKIRIKNLADFQNVGFREQLRLQNVEKEKIVYQNKVRTSFLLAGIAVLVLLGFIFFRNNRQKLKAKIKIEKAYEDLKATQRQLIQSEKMASLGELTAGIAHEIQNPLNFVNNFSEVNSELIDEMQQEMDKGNLTDAKAISNNIKENEQKINSHGKRADAIVKGMLQHSRSSTGVKEPTDINALVDEYLRLAYHGLRAKDKSFNATLVTDYDTSIGTINIIPQDMGRVILNLINNAFYAVSEKKQQAGDGYEPTVTVSTRLVSSSNNPLNSQSANSLIISVKDNGNGIPQKVLDKIFQPFFTTKPTGQGTGLGLSLSYDIVKAHGGELTVETKEARPDEPVGQEGGTNFMIFLPYE